MDQVALVDVVTPGNHARRSAAIAAIQRLQLLAGVLSLVRDEDAGLLLARTQSHRVEIARSGFQYWRKRRRVALVGRMDRRGDDDAGVEIDGWR